MKAKDYNLDWSKWFELDEDSPSGLVWKVPQYFRGTPNYTRVGQPVGSILKTKNNEYWTVGLSDNYVRSTYQIHRIIWVMVNGTVEQDNDVDHRDGNGLNNKIDNLREVPKSINSRNSRKRSDNKSGTSCVVYITTRTGSGYQANFYDLERKRHSKFFSESKYGLETSKQLAINWYDLKKEEMDNAGYTSRHGN